MQPLQRSRDYSFPSHHILSDGSTLDNVSVLSRDFSSFPHRILHLTEEEMADSKKENRLKFETPEYFAYVPIVLQNYLAPEHIYDPSDTPKMKKMKEQLWCARETSPEENLLRGKYKDEWYAVVVMQYELFDQWIADYRGVLAEDVVRDHQSRKERHLRILRGGAELTWDFSDFPYPVLPTTEEDKKDRVIRFQTPEYIAHVPVEFQNYITPENLYHPTDSAVMKEVRRLRWETQKYKSSADCGKALYKLREENSTECSAMDREWNDLDDKYMHDNRDLYGEDLVGGIDQIRKKYADKSFWERLTVTLMDNKGKIALISTVALVGIGCAAFFYSSPYRMLLTIPISVLAFLKRRPIINFVKHQWQGD
jgi:hypothetical protein